VAACALVALLLPLGPNAQATETDAGVDLVGTVRTWVASDDKTGAFLPRDYTLSAVGKHVEIWVASLVSVSQDLGFPPGDCRNDARTMIGEVQLRSLADAFDTVILPRETALFGRPPWRAGEHATLPGLVPGMPADTFNGDGDRLVILVENIRDENFYDTDNANHLSTTSGVFDSDLGDYVDRNVVTLDSYDWAHSSGPNPPDDPIPGDLCRSASARPHQIEGTLAHEYFHLLETAADDDEESWVDEGLAKWTETLTGYTDPSAPVTGTRFSGTQQCIQGYLGTQTPANPNPRPGGPENSLTLWGDQGDNSSPEILCDYGAAGSFMEFVHGRYGDAFMKGLYRDDRHGLDGLQAVLDDLQPGVNALDLVHDWAAMLALDGVLDDGAVLTGGNASAYSAPTLGSTINWDTPDSYDTPGAPPNGGDFIRVKDNDGNYLGAGAIEAMDFHGADTFPPLAMEWIVDRAGHEGDALRSGSVSSADRSLVRSVTVPLEKPTLTFSARYELEEGWDFGFVQVSADDGATYKSLPATTTTTRHDGEALPEIVEQLPGFTGSSDGWVDETVDLSAYAGRDVLLAFRYMSDDDIDEAGWWIDDVTLGGTVLSTGSDLTSWKTATQIKPSTIAGFTVRLVAYTEDHREAWVGTMPLDDSHKGHLDSPRLKELIGTSAEVVSVIVMYDEPTERVKQYAPYTLDVNGTAIGT
jgi:immune inhibitor InhA-like protein